MQGVLAAMSPAVDMHKGYETVATFASETDHILLRVRQDAALRKVKLYYLTDDAAKRTGTGHHAAGVGGRCCPG